MYRYPILVIFLFMPFLLIFIEIVLLVFSMYEYYIKLFLKSN